MNDRRHTQPKVPWRSWMEDLDHIQSPPATYARPAGLGSLGSESYIVEPYKIRSPHRVHIGDNVGIGTRAFLSVVESYLDVEYQPVLRIGDGVGISADVFIHCAGSVEIGAGTGLSGRVFIGDSGRDYEDPDQPPAEFVISEPSPVRIGPNVLVGTGAVILAGVTIGERAFVGAGSVVTRDVPPRAVVFGNPARVIRSWDESTGQWRTGR
jgi:acetyltransferase-like isoleucine patch superfamily enzyme